MRIYLSCLQSPRQYSLPAYKFWEPYFKRGVEEAGYEWVETPEADWAEGLAHNDEASRADWRERTWNLVVDDIRARHRAEPIDLFLGYLYPQQIDAGAVEEIRALGIPCANFFCDNVREFRSLPEPYRAFDLHWVPERAAVDMYRAAGQRVVHRPMPVWVDPSLRTAEHPEEHPATFIGSRDSLREALFAEVLAKGGELELRGPGWLPGSAPPPYMSPDKSLRRRAASQRQLVRDNGAAALLWKATYRLRKPVPDETFSAHARPPVFGDEYARVTQRARVTVGVNRYPSYRRPFSRPDSYSRLRDVEAPMMGACYLSEWTPELAEMYDIGREIETYRSADEMVAKIRELGAHPERRRELRVRGQQRALAEHSVARTIDALLDAAGVPV